MERRLGRGLGSLLGQTAEGTPSTPEAAPQGAAPGTESGGVSQNEAATGEPVGRLIEVAAIRRNPDQPRKVFDSSALEELRQSIAQHGVLQPICVRRVGAGYEIISGERRWRAARSAELTTIPAIVRDDVDDASSLELAIVENVQREDLDPLEKARGYDTLMSRVGLTQDEVARRLGISRSSVANQVRLLDLPHDAQEALAQGLISMGHAKVLLGLKGKKAILKALGVVVRKDLSVRETERLAQDSRGSTDSPQVDGAASAVEGASVRSAELAPAAPWVAELERRLRDALGVKVTLKNGKGYRGSITLEYSGRDELERLADRVAPKDTI